MKLFSRLAAWKRNYEDAHNYTCDICGREVFGGEHICSLCLGVLPWNNGEICPFCGRKVREAGVCLECKQKPLLCDRARSPLLYEGEAVRLVVRLKQGEQHLARAVADIGMETLRKEFPPVDGLVFVPMTRWAKLRRGYNQSRLLCKEFSCRLHVPVLDAAVKKRATKQQKSLGRTAREKNLRDSFHVKSRAAVKGKTLLIVDDALTTGATVSELAGALKRAGAAAVYAFTAASVENKHPFGTQDD